MKKYIVLSIFTAFLLLFNSCGKNTNQNQSSLTNIDEEKKFSLTLYGDEVKVLAKGDLLGNGKQTAIAAIVMKQTDNSYWIRKGSFIQKENDGWKVLLKMEEKLSTPKGNLVEQVDAKDGYIIKFDTTKKPIAINIVMANEYGKATSDEAVLKWNKDTGEFIFTAPYDDIPQ